MSRPVSKLLKASRKRAWVSLVPLFGFSLLFFFHFTSWSVYIIDDFPLEKFSSGRGSRPYPSAEPSTHRLPSNKTAPLPAPPSASSFPPAPPAPPSRVPPNLTSADKIQPEDNLEINLDFPPSYIPLRKWQQKLPQHNLSLPYPEGENGRYVKFSCGIKLLGWNNVLNEFLMNSFLAYKSNRAFVFSDFVRHPQQYPWPQNKSIDWPPRTPTPALMSGPSFGGAWETYDTAPRSVSEDWFEIVCPTERRRTINTNQYKPRLANSTGTEIFETWQRLLLDAPESCIEIQSADLMEDPYPQIFDLMLWGSTRVLSLWEEFSKSPVSRLLQASPTVERVLQQNERIFYADEEEKRIILDPYSRMLAIHLRRGDYKGHCVRLANWNSTYYSWNLLDFLPDKFTPPIGGKLGENTPENVAIYLSHCWPTQQQIRHRIQDSRNDYLRALGLKHRKPQDVDVLYILTDDNGEWLEDLKDMMAGDGWRVMKTNHDLTLDAEGKDVDMAVDMEFATRAAVFLGNGWSSFTSNIVHRRLVARKVPISIRFY